MDYFPREFSSSAIARVEAERIRAIRELDAIRAGELPRPPALPGRSFHVYWSDDDDVLHRCILRIFLAFAYQACGLGRQGTWTIDRVRSEAAEFLRRLTIDLFYSKGSGSYHSGLDGGSLSVKLKRRFEASEEWRKYEDELLLVAEQQVAQPTEPEPRGYATERSEAEPTSCEQEKPLLDPASRSEFPNRAKWLKSKLEERKWTKHDVERSDGPTHKTVQAILDGEPVQDGTINKLVSALSKAPPSLKLAPISPADVPLD
jgi:hypothetical protein